MIMVTTDDPESLRREREHIAAQTRIDPNFIPMVAVSARSQRGRVDLVRLFHTLQEMDYLPVREEIRERIAAMWGVTPAWQGAPEAFGGLSTQTQQLVVMSRVVESDQRLIHQKVIPALLDAFGVTDWTLELPNHEEKAEATKISFIQQRAQVMQTMSQLGFLFTLKEEGVPMEDAEFIISGEMVPAAQMQAEQQAMQLAQQEQQYQMAQAQQQMQEQQMGGGEGGLPAPPGEEGATPIQAMLKADGKFEGRTAGRTPDWHDKAPNEERDIDEYAEARAKKAENRQFGYKEVGGAMNKTWMGDLMNKGFSSPVVKQISPDGTKLWFLQNGVDYVADLGMTGVLSVEKATFNNTKPERPKTPIDETPSVMDITEDI
jgi:SOS response regulatory protein OraA/RecX